MSAGGGGAAAAAAPAAAAPAAGDGSAALAGNAPAALAERVADRLAECRAAIAAIDAGRKKRGSGPPPKAERQAYAELKRKEGILLSGRLPGSADPNFASKRPSAAAVAAQSTRLAAKHVPRKKPGAAVAAAAAAAAAAPEGGGEPPAEADADDAERDPAAAESMYYRTPERQLSFNKRIIKGINDDAASYSQRESAMYYPADPIKFPRQLGVRP